MSEFYFKYHPNRDPLSVDLVSGTKNIDQLKQFLSAKKAIPKNIKEPELVYLKEGTIVPILSFKEVPGSTLGFSFELPILGKQKKVLKTVCSITFDSIRGVGNDEFPSRLRKAEELFRDWKSFDPKERLTLAYCNDKMENASFEHTDLFSGGRYSTMFTPFNSYSEFSFKEDMRKLIQVRCFSRHSSELVPLPDLEESFSRRRAAIMAHPLFEDHCGWILKYLRSIATLVTQNSSDNGAFRRLLINPFLIAAGICVHPSEEEVQDNRKSSDVPEVGTTAALAASAMVDCAAGGTQCFNVECKVPGVSSECIGCGPLDFLFASCLVTVRGNQASNDLTLCEDGWEILQIIHSLIFEAEDEDEDEYGERAELDCCFGMLCAQMFDATMHAQVDTASRCVKGSLTSGQHYMFFTMHIYDGSEKPILTFLAHHTIPILPHSTTRSGGLAPGVVLTHAMVAEHLARLIHFAVYQPSTAESLKQDHKEPK